MASVELNIENIRSFRKDCSCPLIFVSDDILEYMNWHNYVSADFLLKYAVLSLDHNRAQFIQYVHEVSYMRF